MTTDIGTNEHDLHIVYGKDYFGEEVSDLALASVKYMFTDLTDFRGRSGKADRRTVRQAWRYRGRDRRQPAGNQRHPVGHRFIPFRHCFNPVGLLFFRPF